jgi:hypothetical protein
MLYIRSINRISDGKNERVIDNDTFLNLYLDVIKNGYSELEGEKVILDEKFSIKNIDMDIERDILVNINEKILSDSLTEDHLIEKMITSLDEIEKFENFLNLKYQETLLFMRYAPSVNKDFLKLMDESNRTIKEMKEKMENTLKEYIERNAPNLGRLIGYKVAARLIKATGGLRKIAMSSSSSIQIIGAEKAFFRFKKGEGDPPKHGIIYEIPDIYRASRNKAGKIARAYANSIVKAARADISNIHSDVDLKLKKRLEEIRKGQ